ncbi:hypothetical protein [Pedobacter deserti]|uniref:hypothetical protein n=1 Tax=Pedobacter deserti TaxID=2817382 RepID=UPI00210D147C|nr:hypothetical protein [Pedobacter sp. SYSU D00382]
MKALRTLFIAALFFTLGCGKTETAQPEQEPAPEEETERPPLPPAVAIANGLGPSTAMPEGETFILPEGLEWADAQISAVDPFDKDACPCNILSRPNCGTYADGLVNLCIQLKNTTSRPIRVTFPAGLIFIAFDTKVQNGMVIQLETFEVPAHEVGSFKLELHCANSSRHRSYKEDMFTPGPITTVPQVRELLDFIKNKDLTKDAGSAVAQTALWDITDSRGWNEKERVELAALPDK